MMWDRTRRLSWTLFVGVVALAFVAACSGGSEESAGEGGDSSEAVAPPEIGGASADSAQALQPVVLDYVAPTSGASTRNLMRLSVWITEQQYAECGIEGSGFGKETDRYDQVTFPDFERIATDGIGIAEANREENLTYEPIPDDMTVPPVLHEPPPVLPSDQAQVDCMLTAVPEFTEATQVFDAWLRDVVTATKSGDEGQSPAAEATECLRSEISVSSEDLPNLDYFFAMLDGMASQCYELEVDELTDRLAAIDEEGTAAFQECGPPYYDWVVEQFEAARPDFIDQHRETIESLTAVLEARGYIP